MNDKGVYHFIITGHSQGAAISQLLRAYLESEKDKLCKALEINKDSKFFQHKPYLYYWYTKRKFR